jgi:hypothetical protein
MPTISKIPGPYRFYFYSFDCAEPIHVHVRREKMVCKFWLDPLSLSYNDGFPAHELNRIHRLAQAHIDKIIEAWYEHCGEDNP